MVRDVADVMALSGHLPQHPAVAEGQPVHLTAGERQPEGHAVSISSHLKAAAVATRHAREKAVSAVGEVVQVVAGDEVFGGHVGTVLSEERRGGWYYVSIHMWHSCKSSLTSD